MNPFVLIVKGMKKVNKELEEFVGEVMSKMDAYLEGKDDGKMEVYLQSKQNTMAFLRTVFSCLAFITSVLVLAKVW
jgi:hypothetical protein